MARKPPTRGLMGRSMYAPLDLEEDVQDVPPAMDSDLNTLMMAELSASRVDRFRTADTGKKKQRDLTEADLGRLEAQRKFNDKAGQYAKNFDRNKERFSSWGSYALDNEQHTRDEDDFGDIDESGQFHRLRLNAEVGGRNPAPRSFPVVKQKGGGGQTRRYAVQELVEAQQKGPSQFQQVPVKPSRGLPSSKSVGTKKAIVPQPNRAAPSTPVKAKAGTPAKADASTPVKAKPKKVVKIEEPGSVLEKRGHIKITSQPAAPPSEVFETSNAADSQKSGQKPFRFKPLPRPPRPDQPDTWSKGLTNLNQNAWMEHHSTRFRQHNLQEAVTRFRQDTLQEAVKGGEPSDEHAENVVQMKQSAGNVIALSAGPQQTLGSRKNVSAESAEAKPSDDADHTEEVIAQLKDQARVQSKATASVSSQATTQAKPIVTVDEEAAKSEQAMFKTHADEDILGVEENLIDVGDTALLPGAVRDRERSMSVHQASTLPHSMPSPGMRDLQTVNEGPVLLVLNLNSWKDLWMLFANFAEDIGLASMSKLGTHTFFKLDFLSAKAATEASRAASASVRDMLETLALAARPVPGDMPQFLRYDGREVGMPLEEASGPSSEPMIVHGQRILLIRGYTLDDAQLLFFPPADYMDICPGCSEESNILLATFPDHRGAVDAIIDARKEGFGERISWFAATPEYLNVSLKFRKNHENQGRGKSDSVPTRVRTMAICEIPEAYIGLQPRRRIRLSSPPREQRPQPAATVAAQKEQAPIPAQQPTESREAIADEDTKSKYSLPKSPRPSAEDVLSLALSNDPTHDPTGWTAVKNSQTAPSDEAGQADKTSIPHRPVIRVKLPPPSVVEGPEQLLVPARQASGLGGSRFAPPQQPRAPSRPRAVGLGGSRFATGVSLIGRPVGLKPVPTPPAPTPPVLKAAGDDIDYGAQMRKAHIHRTPKPHERLPGQHHGPN